MSPWINTLKLRGVRAMTLEGGKELMSVAVAIVLINHSTTFLHSLLPRALRTKQMEGSEDIDDCSSSESSDETR